MTLVPCSRKALVATALAGTVLAGSAACGPVKELSAAQKIGRAVERLGEQRALSVEFDLDTDAATIKALDAQATAGAPGDEMPTEVAELLADLHISMSVQSRKPLKESEGEDITGIAVKVSSAAMDLAEYRVIGDHSYLRADVKALAAKAGLALSAEDLPEDATALRPLLDGQWIKVSNADLRDAADLPVDVDSTMDAPTGRKFDEALRGVLKREVELTDLGERDGVDHITATAQVRTLLTELTDKVRPFAKHFSPVPELPSAKDLKELSDEKATADFALKNGELTEVTVNLAKLAENAKVKKLDVVVRLGKGGPAVTAPARSTDVTMDELTQEFLETLEPWDLEEPPAA
ncbi:hypothetical protein [Streptomyces sp. NPDC090025]|uniref:hypothetical protein n=1 Tax=Streptomyces sp. NPDC090025 TaxID=3365922 RepID=UPI003837CC78